MDYLYSIDSDRVAEIKIKRSTFICCLRYVGTISDAKFFISSVSSEHKTATHNCWAYIVGDKGEISHSSDNGEPAGTAGKPMLNSLQKYNMTNVAAVVTRYYGGVKLGVRGLIDAYSQAVVSSIEVAPLKKLVHIRRYAIDLSYPFNDTLIHHLSNWDVKIIDTRYSDRISHDIEVESDKCQDVERLLIEYQSCGKLKFLHKP